MSTRFIATGDRRALMGGTAILAVAFLGLRGGPALWRWTDGERRRAQHLTLEVDDSRRIARALAWLRDSAIARQRRSDNMDTLLLQGASGSLAAAHLATELSNDADAAHVKVDAVQSDVGADSNGTIRRVRARASVTGDLTAITRFLALIETAPPVLDVQEISLTLRDLQVANGQPALMHADIVAEGVTKSFRPGAGRKIR